ncbi:MAG: hypothetical protein ABI026_06020 [Gemmatimonadaceae bacterium]
MRVPSCGTLAFLGVLGCTAASPPSSGPVDASTASTKPALVRVVARDFAFDSAHSVPAGLVAIRLVNDGRAIHMLGIVRLDSGKTTADLYHAITENRPVNWSSELGGPGAVSPGDSVTQYEVLEPGTYSMVCWWPDSTGKPHIISGMMSTLTVTGQTAGAPVEPTPDIYLRERDYAIATTGAFSSGHHVFRVDNDGPQEHDVTILRMLPGKTDAEIDTWLLKPDMRDAPVEAVGGVVGVGRWGHTEFAADLKPGNYLIVCLVPDEKDGKPHFMHGMSTKVTVS